ncbi:MAG: hypothetical protein KIT27_05575 [Legionellales bacterium]|nr:hypothetical protein [Legionellales bacterium]
MPIQYIKQDGYAHLLNHIKTAAEEYNKERAEDGFFNQYRKAKGRRKGIKLQAYADKLTGGPQDNFLLLALTLAVLTSGSEDLANRIAMKLFSGDYQVFHDNTINPINTLTSTVFVENQACRHSATYIELTEFPSCSHLNYRKTAAELINLKYSDAANAKKLAEKVEQFKESLRNDTTEINNDLLSLGMT